MLSMSVLKKMMQKNSLINSIKLGIPLTNMHLVVCLIRYLLLSTLYIFQIESN